MVPPSISDVDLTLLRVFRAVVRCGGFTGAQAELNIGASTISTHVARLEERLGMRLCSRGRSGFRLTPEGQRAHDAVERLFGALNAFRLDVADSRGALSGELRLALIDTLITNPSSNIHEALSRFRARGEGCTIKLDTLRPSEVETHVLNGGYDVGIGVFVKPPSQLAVRPLFEERHSLYCGKGHPLFSKRRSDAVSLSEIFASAYVDRGNLEIASARPNFGFVNRSATCASIEGIALLVLSGRFVAYLPDHYAFQWVQRGRMVALAARQLHHKAAIASIHLKRKAQPRLVAAFLDDLRAAHAHPIAASVPTRGR
jgi:DNA-binding transcriptional LysR family regulator